MRVWIPGGRGMLGQALSRVLQGRDVVVTGHELDIGDANAVEAFVSKERPSHILNCAAYTKVDACEGEEPAALKTNGEGPGVVGAAALAFNAIAVHVSTDYVFDGNGQAPYTESDPTNPLSAYGRTKLRGEERFLYGTQGNGIVVRTSWLYGKGGKNFVSTMRTLMADREEVRVVDDQRGRPTWTDDLAEAIARLAGLRERARAAGGIYHYANAGETTWHGFASAIRDEIVHRGWPCKAGLIKPIPTSAYPTPARRPPYSVFSTAKVEAALGETPRPWREALAMYLDDA